MPGTLHSHAREWNPSQNFPLSNTGVDAIAAFLVHLFTHVLAVLLHICPSAEHHINSVTDFIELIKCALENGGHSVLFESLSLMGGRMEAGILSCYQGPWQVMSRERDGEVSRRKRRQISGSDFAREKLKRWEYFSVYHLSSECSDSEVEVAKLKRVPGVR